MIPTDKKIIQSYILDYLKLRIPDFQIKSKMFTCPKCSKISANIFPLNSNRVFCYSPECKNLGDIFDLCKQLDFNDQDLSEDEIADYLKKELNIQTNDDLDKLLAKYSNWGWDLVPIVKNSKVPSEKEWTKKNHKDLREWKNWLNNSSSIGLKCGAISQTTVIDVDLITKEEAEIWQKGTATKTIEEIIAKKESNLQKLKALNLFNDTVMQDSGWKGIHYFYKYESGIPKSSFEYEGFRFDIENDGGYVLIEPSMFADKGRKISGEEISVMSENLGMFILKQIRQSPIDNLAKNQTDEIGKIKGLAGNCNNTFIKVLGQFRKFMPLETVEKSAYILNNEMLDDPMENKTIRSMCQQLEKYHVADVGIIGEKIIDHLRIVDTAHVRDLKECLGYDRKDLEQALKELVGHKKVLKIKKDLYKLIADVEWQEDFLSIGKPLDIKVPYFDEYANFDNGSMLILGSSSGYGKTTTSVNIIKQLVNQGITPYLISTEAGSKFQKIAQSIGLKEGDFKYFITTDPTSVNLQHNAVTILDWLKPQDSDYAKFDSIYEKLNNQLVERGGLLIVLAQLKKENNSFYAENMTMFFGALVAKLLYEKSEGIENNAKPYFETIKIRDSKVNKQFITIPLSYDYQTKLLEIRK